jgi:metal-responsive CopG/Arc/MetJ family transcriptional regulator
VSKQARHTTTVRFDADLWARLCEVADRLGVNRSELVRDATREHLVRLEHRDRLTQLEERVDGLAQTIVLLSRGLRALRAEVIPIGARVVRAAAGKAPVRARDDCAAAA